MKIGIVGGTGAMGRGFALRWSNNHHIMIGSRDARRAADSASAYGEAAAALYGRPLTVTGGDNLAVARDSDVLILSIPYENIDVVCPAILPSVRDDCVVVSGIVPMTRTDAGFEFVPYVNQRKTAHESVASHMRDGGRRLVSAFHVISEKKLADPKIKLDYDIFVCGDDEEATDIVGRLITEIEGLRPIRLGPGRLAYMAEIATPLLLNAMIRNKMPNPGIKLV